MTDHYSDGVKKSIKKAPLVLVGLAVLYIGTGFLFKAKPSGFIPLEDGGRLFITYELPEAASTGRSLATLDTLMQILDNTPGIMHYAGLGG